MATMKLKSHKGASKRLSRTGTGKLVRRKAGRRHILTSKSRARKRRLQGTVAVDRTMVLSLSRLMPYN